jgi:hypothetical protein
MQALEEIYAVSNTPIYLHTHFRRDRAVQQIADKASARELLHALWDFASRDLDLDATVKVYALLAALSHKPARELGLLKRLPQIRADWFARLAQLAWGDAPRDTYAEINIENKPAIEIEQVPLRTAETGHVIDLTLA